MKTFVPSVVVASLVFLTAISANAQSSTTPPTQLPKVTVKPLGTPIDIGAKPPAGNPGKNPTVSPDVFTTPATRTKPGDTAIGATVTIPLGSGNGKK